MKLIKKYRWWILAAFTVLLTASTIGWVYWSITHRNTPKKELDIELSVFPDEIFSDEFTASIKEEALSKGIEVIPNPVSLANAGLIARKGSCEKILTTYDDAPKEGSPEIERLKYCAKQIILEDLKYPELPKNDSLIDITAVWDDSREQALDADIAKAALLLDLNPVPKAKELWESVSRRGKIPDPKTRAEIIKEEMPEMLDDQNQDELREAILLHLLHLSRSSRPRPGMAPKPD